jgi:hypothetical protein
MKKTALHAAVSIALGSALLLSTAAEARPIRIDDGTEVGSSGSWFPIPDLSVPLTIGFELSFLGQTADSLEIDDGGIRLFNGAVEVGSILAFGDGLSPVASAHEWVTLDQPIGPVNGVDITDAFRVLFRSTDALKPITSQLAFFKAANGDSFIEFNYDDGNASEGFDFSGGPAFGVISDGTTQFDLRSWVSANQSGCLGHWGAFDDLTPPELNSSECTAYFANGDLTSVGPLPLAFVAENGGSPDPSSNPIANYRYVVRYAAGTTQPPTPVPAPATLTLLLSGLVLTAAARSRKRGRA